MKDRIIQFLKSENISSTQFAEEIGVQPSGISHIISGRNNPSLDFVIKMLSRYTNLSSEWLLFGKGKMYKNYGVLDLFDNESINQINVDSEIKPESRVFSSSDKDSGDPELISDENSGSDSLKRAERIVYFYNNGTFSEYFPQSKT